MYTYTFTFRLDYIEYRIDNFGLKKHLQGKNDALYIYIYNKFDFLRFLHEVWIAAATCDSNLFKTVISAWKLCCNKFCWSNPGVTNLQGFCIYFRYGNIVISMAFACLPQIFKVSFPLAIDGLKKMHILCSASRLCINIYIYMYICIYINTYIYIYIHIII